ncbi:tyrosine-protein phosphatase [Flavobacterium aciduliphilum]|uniref:protein-tyrosine-phosphatase n=1 Tax=Flavobacterium aciduliphilum TaxID=1101402 RepID=A0A328YFX4_9FLAO|nr:CpsB/CapC family capsule biosynthesis tyrosine phosphatase [Flavobacterium aciduliphilum]RAR69300.1 tyrosine-protein phosphatase YwqE [Flavobacterium aciduliphilum]
MLHFFKQKPFLADFIPQGYIDIHSHLLPNIDDGAGKIEDTKELIEGLEQLGFSKFITTPHVMSQVWKNTKEGILSNYKDTLHKLPFQDFDKRFRVAAEYMIDSEFESRFSSKSLLTLKENYVLVEMSYLTPPVQLHEMLYELQNIGYKPVLAHPERYNYFHNALANYDDLKDRGCSFQINALSTVGYYGQNITKIADYLLKNNLVDFIGSDVHHTKHVESFKNRIQIKNELLLKEVFLNNSFFDF